MHRYDIYGRYPIFSLQKKNDTDIYNFFLPLSILVQLTHTPWLHRVCVRLSLLT